MWIHKYIIRNPLPCMTCNFRNVVGNLDRCQITEAMHILVDHYIVLPIVCCGISDESQYGKMEVVIQDINEDVIDAVYLQYPNYLLDELYKDNIIYVEAPDVDNSEE